MKIPFKVSARTARLIGRENVANAQAAIIELVKNSYDADATKCVIGIDDRDLEKITMYIADNGSGMNREVIEDIWMTIGTNNKLHDFETDTGRIKSGAKGIGRFALDKLGDTCLMYSTIENSENTLMWSVDWSTFEEEENKTLDKVTAELSTIENFTTYQVLCERDVPDDFANHFEGCQKGTLFIIDFLRENWDTQTIRKLYKSLEALSPPNIFGFQNYLYQFSNTEDFGEILPSMCQDYDYKLHAKCVDQIVSIVVTRNEHDIESIPKEVFNQKGMANAPFDFDTFSKRTFNLEPAPLTTFVSGFADSYGEESLKALGDFEMTLYFLKRQTKTSAKEKYYYKDVNSAQRKRWLEQYWGIKLFRDNFRVRPYGEEGTGRDWLDLGARQSNSPAAVNRYGQYRVRPNNMTGAILISRLTNVDFEDKSSREGLQDSHSFRLFRNVILGILRTIEDDRSYIANQLEEYELLTNQSEKIKQEAKKEAERITSESKNKSSQSYTSEEKLAFTVQEQIKEIEVLLSEKRLLASFASIGILSSSFAHELKSLERKLGRRFETMKSLISPLIQEKDLLGLPEHKDPFIFIKDNIEEDEKVKNWLKFTLESIKSDKRRRKKVFLSTYFNRLKVSWQKACGDRGIDFVFDSDDERIYIRMFEMDFDTIFNNLIVNSMDAFKSDRSPREKNQISISVTTNEKFISVIYKDNGPGLSKDIKDPNKIFVAQYSTKVSRDGEVVGTGLGMWLVKNTVIDYSASIEILGATENKGFSTEIKIPRTGQTI
ncbi:sensor histidine kinase [Leucothrix sargassi]|nr:sensor histidine kinase [Leucothrix sargassi]